MAEASGTIRRVESAAELRWLRGEVRGEGRRVALVPTMGALHEGHLSLVRLAARLADEVWVSVFVNPTQFGPGEDLESYPRDPDRDAELARGAGASLVFAPSVAEMYPEEQRIWVTPGPLGERLCGASRPGHFRGVLTVVAKLLHLAEPEVAVFGRKDYQQAVLVQRMATQLAMPVEVRVGPTVREEDGLALSSRNAYLSAQERERARALPEALRAVRSVFGRGERRPAPLLAAARAPLEAVDLQVDYVELVDPVSLEPVAEAGPETVCALAAFVGPARLIDNATLGGQGGP